MGEVVEEHKMGSIWRQKKSRGPVFFCFLRWGIRVRYDVLDFGFYASSISKVKGFEIRSCCLYCPSCVFVE